MPNARIEMDAEEVGVVLGLVRARLAEVERMQQSLEEGEGMDLPRHNALKSLGAQREMLEILTLKLEGASRETRER